MTLFMFCLLFGFPLGCQLVVMNATTNRESEVVGHLRGGESGDQLGTTRPERWRAFHPSRPARGVRYVSLSWESR